MKLNDYAKSTRRGREANRMEREAMSDPFLSDAIDGLDAVYANHTDILSQLENKVAKLSRKKRKVRPLPTEMDALAQPPQVVGEPDVQPLAAELSCAKTDDGEEMNEKVHVPVKESAGVEEIPESGQKPPMRPRKRHTALWVSIAAVFVLCASGTALWYFDLIPLERHTNMVAQHTVQETHVPELSGQEFMEEADAAEPEELSDIDMDTALISFAPAEQTDRAVEKSKAKAEPEPLKSDIKFTPPVIVADADVKEEELLHVDALDDTKVVVAEIISDDQKAAKKALEEATQGVSSKAVAESKPETELQSAEPKDRIPVVVNPEFNQYFEANMTVHTDSNGNRIVGKVVAEFRVNTQGIPSGVRIISSPKIDMGREVVQLLISGPRWTPTHGQRVRVEVEYK